MAIYMHTEKALKVALSLVLISAITTSLSAQVSYFEVYGLETHSDAIPYPLVTLDTLEGAQHIEDLHGKFPSDWIQKYISVHLTANCGSQFITALGSSNILTDEQMQLLWTALDSCDVDLHVDYLPKNNLKYNPVRKLNYTLRLVPIYEAKFPGGRKALNSYIENQIISRISSEDRDQIDLISVRFKINPAGKVSQVRMEQICGLEDVERNIQAALKNMPDWTPAMNRDKEPIVQEYQLNLGSELMRCDWRLNQMEKIR